MAATFVNAFPVPISLVINKMSLRFASDIYWLTNEWGTGFDEKICQFAVLIALKSHRNNFILLVPFEK